MPHMFFGQPFGPVARRGQISQIAFPPHAPDLIQHVHTIRRSAQRVTAQRAVDVQEATATACSPPRLIRILLRQSALPPPLLSSPPLRLRPYLRNSHIAALSSPLTSSPLLPRPTSPRMMCQTQSRCSMRRKLLDCPPLRSSSLVRLVPRHAARSAV